jgi:hypothetical protein
VAPFAGGTFGFFLNVRSVHQQWLNRLDHSLLFMESGAHHLWTCWPGRFHHNLLSFPRNQSTRSERY